MLRIQRQQTAELVKQIKLDTEIAPLFLALRPWFLPVGSYCGSYDDTHRREERDIATLPLTRTAGAVKERLSVQYLCEQEDAELFSRRN